MSKSGRTRRGARFWAILVAGAAAAIWIALSFGQTRSVTVDNNRLPDPASVDAAQVSPAFSPASASLALQLRQAGVRHLAWPLSIRRAIRAIEADRDGGDSLSRGLTLRTTTAGTRRQGGPPPSEATRLTAGGGFALLEPWPGGTMRTERVLLDGRVFYFLMADPGSERRPHFDAALTGGQDVFDGSARRDVIVAVEEGADSPAASFVTQGEPRYIMQGARRGDGKPIWTEYRGPSSFAAVATKNGPVVIYRDRGGIFARRLIIRDREPVFGERWRIAGMPEEISHYQLVARSDERGGVHLLWSLQPASETQGGNAHLTYCRIDALDRNLCDDPQVLSETVSWRPVNLMVQDRHVYVSWIDTRHTTGIWDRRNFAKLYVAASRDGGGTFDAPVAVNDPGDNADNARYALTAPTDAGGVLVFWTTKPVQGGWWQRLPFHVGWLDPAPNAFRVGRTTEPGRKIRDLIEQAVLRHHEDLGR